MTDEAALTERETLAAEWVLGLLDGERLLQARGHLARDPAFAEEVARWEDRFAPLLASWEDRAPPPDLWQRIAGATVNAPLADAGADVVALRRSRDRWRWLGGLSAAAAAVLAVVVMTGPASERALTGPTPSDAPPLAATVPIADTPLRLDVTYLPDRAEVLIAAPGLTPDGVHDHELWHVLPDGSAQSLGLVVPGDTVRVALSPDVAERLANGSPLVLTREPLGGAAGGTAGPVVAEGTFEAI